MQFASIQVRDNCVQSGDESEMEGEKIDTDTVSWEKIMPQLY